jgi:hypothetical protein
MIAKRLGCRNPVDRVRERSPDLFPSDYQQRIEKAHILSRM